MGTCSFLMREDGKLFDLDKAYGLYEHWSYDWRNDDRHYYASRHYDEGVQDKGVFLFEGYIVDLGTEVDALMKVLEQHQPHPCGPNQAWRREWAEKMIAFAQCKPVRLFDENTLPDDVDYNDPDVVIGERWTEHNQIR